MLLEHFHAVFTNMLHTAELDMAESVNASDIDIFFADAAWAICSTHHTVFKASPGAVIFGRDMLFEIPFIADWKKIGEHRQRLTDLNNAHENKGRIECDYKVGQKILVRNKGIHQKQHYVPYYLSNFFLSLKYAFGIISMFFTLVRCSIILSRLF